MGTGHQSSGGTSFDVFLFRLFFLIYASGGQYRSFEMGLKPPLTIGCWQTMLASVTTRVTQSVNKVVE